MDRSWINKPRNHNEYKEGVKEFFDFAFGMHLSVERDCVRTLVVLIVLSKLIMMLEYT